MRITSLTISTKIEHSYKSALLKIRAKPDQTRPNPDQMTQFKLQSLVDFPTLSK
jgi:hypothetical protein